MKTENKNSQSLRLEQCLRVKSTFSSWRGLCWVPSTPVASESYLSLKFKWCGALFGSLRIPDTHVVRRYLCRQNTHTLKNYKNNEDGPLCLWGWDQLNLWTLALQSTLDKYLLSVNCFHCSCFSLCTRGLYWPQFIFAMCIVDRFFLQLPWPQMVLLF